MKNKWAVLIIIYRPDPSGGELEENTVEKPLRGGHYTIIIKVTAEAYLHCGESLYTEDVVRSFEKIRSKLKSQGFSHCFGLRADLLGRS